MKHTSSKSARFLAVVLTIVMLVSAIGVPASAYYVSPALDSFVSGDVAVLGKQYDDVTEAQTISLSEKGETSYTIPVAGMTADEVNAAYEAGELTLSLVRNADRPYNSTDLYPNQSNGGELSTWKTQLKGNMFAVKSLVASEKDGNVSVNVVLENEIYFGSRNVADPSAPHSNGGAYLDICGWFDLCLSKGDTQLGKASAKVAPYVNFHTMAEIYVQLEEIVKTGKDNGLYVVEKSMGQSTAGREMPYLIMADSQASVDKWLALTEKAETNPAAVLADIESGALDDIRVPVLYSNVHSNEVAAADGVLDFATMLAEAGINGKLSYKNLTGFTDAGKAELQAEFDKYSVAVPDLVKDSATYLGYITDKNNGKSGVVDLDKYYTSEEVEVSVKDMLEDVFFIVVPEENVDGRTYVTRHSSNGFDLNRDNSFQTTVETANMQYLIGTYNPVSFTEYHGRVTAFQCEPCDPPHEPNFEYDLLAEHLISGGESFGIAAVANNDGYNSYVIPQRDYLEDQGDGTTYWADPWDDMSTSYTPQFAMLHGACAYTVELPAYNDYTAQAVTMGILGQANYIAGEKLGYLESQTEIYKRGVENFNSDAYDLVGQWLCDQYDVEGAEMDLFRPEYDGEGQNGNFYPECYIIPMDRNNQGNIQAASEMMEWLTRNDVKVNVTTKAFTYDGVEYPAGTMVVPMYQAKRSVANGALYSGTLINSWTVLYSEGITSFNETRGFDMATVAEPAAYKTIKATLGAAMDHDAAVSYINAKVGTSFAGVKYADVIISNNSEDAVAAVNALLKAGKTVGMITEGANKGDFVCSYTDYLTVAKSYIFTATGVAAGTVTAQIIDGAPTVFITGEPAKNTSGFVYTNYVGSAAGWNYDRAALEMMNFNVTKDVTAADAVIGASRLSGDALKAVQEGTPYIGYTSSAATNLVPGLTRTGLKGAMDCKGYVTYSGDTLVTASYEKVGDDVLYGYGLGYFSAVPENATVLVTMDKTKTPTEGFIPTYNDTLKAAYNDFLGGVQAVAYNDGTINVVLFANSLTNKVHQRDEYGFISNFIFANNLSDEAYEGQAKTDGFVDVKAGSYYEDAVDWAVANDVTNGTDATHFSPDASCTRAQAVTFLYRAMGCPAVENVENTFVDIQADQWYTDAVLWAISEGITNGTDETHFSPNAKVTRAQVVTFMYRAAKAEPVNAENPFTDIKDGQWYTDAVLWAVDNNITNGMSDTVFGTNNTCTRAQMVTFLYRFSQTL